MDGLEDRVKLCSDENMSLQKRIRLLETENKSLLSQLKRLQNILTGQGGNQASTPTVTAITAAPSSTGGTSTNANSKESLSTSNTAQPATCLLVLMLSFALFLLPNLRPDSSKSLTDGRTNSAASQMAQSMMKMPPFAGK
jgi:cyclic AMP-responsive element-binding protein 3